MKNLTVLLSPDMDACVNKVIKDNIDSLYFDEALLIVGGVPENSTDAASYSRRPIQ